MPETFNIYCDESCHLLHDKQKVMVLGAVWCPTSKARHLADGLRAIKVLHNIDKAFEIKWTKVSPAKLRFYQSIIHHFCAEDDLRFRALIVPDKHALVDEDPDHDHDACYYRMYFDMLKILLDPTAKYRIYIDIKDTRGAEKIKKLHDALCESIYDFDAKIIERVQLVRSHEVEQMQLTDLLTGCVSYANRQISTSAAKLSLVRNLRGLTGYTLTKNTLVREQKINIFRWHPKEM